MITAEEFWHSVSVQSSLDQYGNWSQWDIEYAMIEFARLKGKEILEAAYEKAELKEREDGDEDICYMTNDYGDSWVLDKGSILNSYDLNSIV